MLKYKILLAALLVLTTLVGAEARNINLHGVVTAKHNGEPLQGVCIFNTATEKLIGTTNHEGKYMITVDDGAEIEFHLLGSVDKRIAVDGRLNIDVALERESMTLEELVVQAKRVTKNIQVEQTDMDIVGNYLQIHTRVKMPRELFNSSSRLVLQPMLYNVTRRQISYLTPIVYDGWRYAATQERMYDFDRDRDPLTPYVEIKRTSGRTDDLIAVNDSAYAEHPGDDFRCDMMLSIENYNRIVYGDTVTFARGVVNPLRFLEMNLSSVYVTDPDYLPTPDMQLRDGAGTVNLSFLVGQSRLDLNLGDNRAEMDRLLAELRAVQDDPNAALKSFSITGTASPEGNYAYNLRLSRSRMNSAMAMIFNSLDGSTQQSAELNSDAEVEKWETVVEMLRADGHDEEARAVAEVIDRYPSDMNLQFRGIARLPFYGSLIKDTYLPRLRRVSYRYETSRYRFLTDEEIAQMYRNNPRGLATYEYWRLYSLADSLPMKEEIARHAVEAHPKFLVGASDLTNTMVQQGRYDSSILEPLMTRAGENAPDEARAVLASVYLNEGRFNAADSLTNLLPLNEPRYHKVIVYSKALNGRLDEVIEEISAESPFNEVLMLLAVKSNDQAWEKAQKLGETAKEEYIKAVAANRMDQYLAAIDHLEQAFRLDPSLRETARVDGDLVDLLEDDTFKSPSAR